MGLTQGEAVRVSVAWTLEATGTAYDPDATTLTVVAPDLTKQVPAVVRDGLGLYHADVVASLHGRYSYRWEAAGADPGAAEGVFFVDRSAVLG